MIWFNLICTQRTLHIKVLVLFGEMCMLRNQVSFSWKWILCFNFFLERSVSEFDIITSILNGYNKLVRPIDPVNNVTHSLIPKETIEFVSIFRSTRYYDIWKRKLKTTQERKSERILHAQLCVLLSWLRSYALVYTNCSSYVFGFAYSIFIFLARLKCFSLFGLKIF